MKRRNPETGDPFRVGEIRSDGRVFMRYEKSRLKKNGFYKERWVSSEQLFLHSQSVESYKAKNGETYKKNKKAKKSDYAAKKAISDKNWAERNRARSNAHKQRWNKNNAGVVRALNRKRFAAQIQRTPKWLDAVDHAEMEFTYIWCNALRSCGLDHHVDHIVPLQGKIVSGLHVPWNLRVIPAAENLSKHNRWNNA